MYGGLTFRCSFTTINTFITNMNITVNHHRMDTIQTSALPLSALENGCLDRNGYTLLLSSQN